METWRVDTGEDVVPSNAKFATSVDPSPQTSGPEAVDAGQSSRVKNGGDWDFHWSLPRTSQSSTLHAWVPRGLRWLRWVRINPRVMPPAALQELVDQVKQDFVLRPLASIRDPSGTSCCTSVPELASRKSTAIA